jgi:LPS-assembly protein
VKRLDLDRAAEVGEARNATVVFKGVPMFYMPWVSFPLSDKRKSGFLTPVFGSTGRSGIEASVPYYWNIAPNMDATLTPRVLSKRGLQAQNEFRYLWPLFHGEAHADLLPNDRQTDLNRYFLTWAHAQNLTHGWSSNLNLQKASDDNYFRDLSTRLADTSTTNLPRDGLLTYSARYWNFSTRLLSYQHLLDPARPATPDEIPYRMRPQFLFNAERQNVYRADWTLAADWTDFSHPSKANGKRFLLYPSVSYPITRSYAFLTPRLGYHHTEYTLSENFTGDANFTRNLPIYSVDSGVIFERDLRYKDEPLLQTLEPRLFYVRIPFREQSQIPNFSTTQADFNFAQIYTENQFIGGDRVNDANQLTAGVSTRFIEQKTGIERLRAGIAQRLYFNEPRVTLSGPNVALGRRTSDLLIGFDGQISKKWAVDGLWQYNPDSRRSEKLSIGGRYNPEPGKVANLAYRTARATLTQPTEVPDQVDFSVQWPLWKHWYGLGRVNYAIGESKLLEGLAGLEYNRGCWELRLVAHRFITAEQQVSTSFFVQLELNGLSRFGTNPLEALRQNIPGYVKSQETNP